MRDTESGLDKLNAVTAWRSAEVYSPKERLGLEVAEAMTRTGQGIDDNLMGRLKSEFSEAQIVELAAAVAFENFRSRLNPALGVEAQGFCLRKG